MERYDYGKLGFRISKLSRSMKGAHQANNMALAITAFFEVAATLDINVNKNALQKGVKEAAILGRFEEILPYVILDGAHNPASVEKLLETIKYEFPGEQIAFVIGILADKDVQEILQLFEQVSNHFYFVDFNNPRAMSAQNMLELSGAPYKEVLVDYASFLQQRSERKLRTIVTGSLYLLTEVRSGLKNR